MYITELKAGDKILITLNKSTPAYPTLLGNSLLYKTGKQYRRKQDAYFNEGTANVLLNSERVLVLTFAGLTNPSFSGVAEIDYSAVKSIYLYTGETNADTVAEGLYNKSTAPAMNIYRKKIILKWTESP